MDAELALAERRERASQEAAKKKADDAATVYDEARTILATADCFEGLRKPDLSTLVKATHLKKGEGGWTKLDYDDQLEYLEKADVYTLFCVAKPTAEYLNDQVQAPKPKKRRTTTQDIRQMDDADLEAQLKWLQEEVQRRSTGTGAAPDDDRDA